MDHLALLGIRGYPLDQIYSVWTQVLYDSNVFPRIRGMLASPFDSWESRAAALMDHLAFLKTLGVLDVCFAGIAASQGESTEQLQIRRRLSFERVEYIGDCAWGTHIAHRLMLLFPNEQWQYSERVYFFNCTRDAVEMNITLELLFDSLKLMRLLPTRSENVGSGKIKADVVEAVLGELHCIVWGLQPQMEDELPFVEVNGTREDAVLQLAQHCLSELYDLLVLGYMRELSWNALPLAKWIAARNLWMETNPPFRAFKGGRHFQRRHLTPSAATPPAGGGSSATAAGSSSRLAAARYVLPACLSLNSAPSARPTELPHPLTEDENLPRGPATAGEEGRHQSLPFSFSARQRLTMYDYTSTDVFHRFHRAFQSLGFLHGSTEHLTPKIAHISGVERYVSTLVPSLATDERSRLLHAAEGSRSLFLRDGYYDLLPTSTRSTSSGEEKGDGRWAIRTLRRPLAVRDVKVAVQLALGYVMPPLMDEETAAAYQLTHHPQGSSSSTPAGGQSNFNRSRWVPFTVKPPPVGVDLGEQQGRSLHPGAFAYVGVGVADHAKVVRRWERMRGESESSLTEEEPATVVTTESEGAGQEHTSQSKEGEAKPEDLSITLAVWQFFVKRAQEKWAEENLYFPARKMVLGGAAGMKRMAGAAVKP